MSGIPAGHFHIVFSPEGTFPPPPGARHAVGRKIEEPIVVEPVGPEPGVNVWRVIPSNEGENLYGIFALIEHSLGFALAGDQVYPDARVILGNKTTPWIIQVEEVDGGFFGTIQARTSLIGAIPYLSVEGNELALKFVPVIPDPPVVGKWFLQRV